MASPSIPKAWIPYMNTKDCSQGFCTIYCPQWCYIILPPPPPLDFFDDDPSPNFSPLVIAIIGILSSAFLLVGYYTIISKYCGNPDSARTRRRRRRRDHHEADDQIEDYHNPSLHEPWHVVGNGLDETVIKSITVCKYKRNEGLVDVTECSVCLREFQEDESLRLLPKCSHAFHVPCIDTWLKSHSNCPLCRASIVSSNASHNQLVSEVVDNNSNVDYSLDGENEERRRSVSAEDTEIVFNEVIPKTPLRIFSDLGNLMVRDAIINIKDDEFPQIRRSVSLDCSSSQARLLIADILRKNDDYDDDIDLQMEDEDCQCSTSVGDSWKQHVSSCSNGKSRVLYGVRSPIAMKRSFSGGGFFFTRQGRRTNPIIPL
ncbi:Zinc finger, RING-type [Dillenia turbinata]|uniref:RING-type E3 ubiquitin transferase n=1 Tax=Dillenia turbinata TaxID=194707 RepID=A0AAN8ZHY0_9MAGN